MIVGRITLKSRLDLHEEHMVLYWKFFLGSSMVWTLSLYKKIGFPLEGSLDFWINVFCILQENLDTGLYLVIIDGFRQ